MATNYFRERARNPYLRARPPAPGLEQEPNASPVAPTDFLAPSPRRAVAPPPEASAFDPAQTALAILPALRARGGAAPGVRPDVGSDAFLPPATGNGRPDAGSLAFLPPPAETFATPPRAVAPPVDPIEQARAAYQTGTPTTFGGKFKQAGLNALLGFLQAASRDRENPIAAGLGGAATGGIISAASPKIGRSYLFEQLERPGVEEKLRREEALRKKQQDAEDRALKRQETEADVGYKRALTTKALAPERAVAPRLIRTDRGLWNEATGRIVPGTEPSPKELTPQRVWTDRGMVEVSKLSPEELSKLRPYQRPRQSGGGGGGSSRKEMRSAGVAKRQFERLKSEAIRAQQMGEEETFNAKRNEMEALADDIDALYGDSVEVGESGGWPYVKFRQGSQRQSAGQGQKTATAADIQAAVKESGLSEAEVKKRFRAKGWAVQ